MPDYQQSKIYVLKRTKDDSIFYVGSTVCPLSKRMVNHRKALTEKRHKTQPVYKYINKKGGRDTFYIELYKRYPCETVEELRRMEGRVILRLKREGAKLQNYQIAGRTRAEYKQTVKAKEYNKAYNKTQKVKEYRKAYNKAYRKTEKAKEFRKAYNNKRIECQCGRDYMTKHKSRHVKSAHHIANMALKEDE